MAGSSLPSFLQIASGGNPLVSGLLHVRTMQSTPSRSAPLSECAIRSVTVARAGAALGRRCCCWEREGQRRCLT